ncbi:MAG: biotin-dependent carboxyltransferase family protein [Agarilytica sp.]
MNVLGELKILRAGPQCLLQDLGRTHVQDIGFCQSGAADEHAFLWANKLLDNNANCAALEITFGPFEAEFNINTRIAICGAAKSAYINDKQISAWVSLPVEPGDRLRIENFSNGVLTYLAIQNGFRFSPTERETPPFKSNAMSPREHSGPNNGKPFKSGDSIFYPILESPSRKTFFAPARFVADYRQKLNLNFVPNPSIPYSELTQICQQEFKVHPNSNRMAYRLSFGSDVTFPQTSQRSSGTPYGTIQLTPNGDVLVLMKDRQTIGGYTTLGCVRHLDLFSLSQRRAGDTIKLFPTDVKKAQEKLLSFYRFFRT